MKSIIGILFITRQTLKELENQFNDDLNIKTSVIFCLSGLAQGFQMMLVEKKFLYDLKIWMTTLLLISTGFISLIYG